MANDQGIQPQSKGKEVRKDKIGKNPDNSSDSIYTLEEFVFQREELCYMYVRDMITNTPVQMAMKSHCSG